MKRFLTHLSLLGTALFPLASCAPREIARPESPEDVRIVYIAKNLGNPYFESIHDGFRGAQSELGFEFSTTAPPRAEATSQLPHIRQQIQRRVNVLSISPNSNDALNTAFRDAMERGIIVLSANSDMPGSESFRHGAILPTDFDRVGASLIELMGSLIDYEGQFAILSATTDAPDQNYWIQGMRETLLDPKYSRMELVAVVFGDDDPQKSLLEAEALITRFPNLRGIISPTTVGIAAAAQAVESAKAAPRIQVTGLGTPDQMRRFIKNGTVQAFALWNPYNVGYVAAYYGTLLALGQIEPVEGSTFTTPKLGEFTLGPNGVVIAGPPLIFTAENIDDFHF